MSLRAYNCWYCGIDVTRTDDSGNQRQWTADHLVPRSRGGSGLKRNKVVACRPCNSQKRNRTVEEYREYLRLRMAKEELGMPSEAPLSAVEWVLSYFALEPSVQKAASRTIRFWGETDGTHQDD